MISHIVLFQPKASLSASDKRLFAQTLVDVCSELAWAERVSIGRRVSIDAGYDRSFGDKTYEYSAVLDFATREDLIRYLTHPLHAKLGQLFWENCERAIVSETEVIDLQAPSAIDVLVL
jgi:hypothetical protein